MTEHDVPGSPAMIRTLAGITVKRLTRGKALWIGGLFAALPVLQAGIVHSWRFAFSPRELFVSSMLLLALLPAIFVGASVGEELEERTSTYLWSRPIARWAVLGGKLVALIPVVVVLGVGGWIAGNEVGGSALPSLASCLGLAAGYVATSLVVAGIAVVVPRHGMALTIGYMLVDLFVGEMPFSLQQLALTYQTRALAGFTGDPAIGAPLIALAVIAGIWTAVGVLRIRRLEV
ncbi:MAG TPA: ABC transporter permease [Kofleriaceae bacterium]|jgi:hypothetical protein